MRKLTLALSTAALALSGAAAAQSGSPAAPQAGPAKMRAAKPDMTRADAQARAEAMFARMDANKDGTITEADRAARQAAMFDRLDADRNGALTRTELAAGHGARAGKGKAGMMKHDGAAAMSEAQKTERGAAMFARLDADGNGAVSRAEFDAMHTARAGMGEGKMAGSMDHNMGAGMGAGMGDSMGAGMNHAAPGGRHAMMMGAMDGPVTRKAFVDRALGMFDRADANRDGTVTQAERQTMRESMRQQWRAKKAPGQPG